MQSPGWCFVGAGSPANRVYSLAYLFAAKPAPTATSLALLDSSSGLDPLKVKSNGSTALGFAG